MSFMLTHPGPLPSVQWRGACAARGHGPVHGALPLQGVWQGMPAPPHIHGRRCTHQAPCRARCSLGRSCATGRVRPSTCCAFLLSSGHSPAWAWLGVPSPACNAPASPADRTTTCSLPPSTKAQVMAAPLLTKLDDPKSRGLQIVVTAFDGFLYVIDNTGEACRPWRLVRLFNGTSTSAAQPGPCCWLRTVGTMLCSIHKEGRAAEGQGCVQ